MTEPLSPIAWLFAFFVAGPIAFWFAAHAYFDKRLGSNARYRQAQAQLLREPRATRLYLRAFDSGLRFLDQLMGKLEVR